MEKQSSVSFYLSLFLLAAIGFSWMNQQKGLARLSQKISELEIQIKGLKSAPIDPLQDTNSAKMPSAGIDSKQICHLFNGHLKNEKTSPYCELEFINQIQADVRDLRNRMGTQIIGSNSITPNFKLPPPDSVGGGAEVTESDKVTVCSALWGTATCVEGKVVCPTGTEKVFLRTGESRRKLPKSHFFCR